MNNNRETLPSGYMGRILKINLSNQTYKSNPLDPELTELFFGGRGLGVALLYRHFLSLENTGKYENAIKEVDPFSEDNVLIFSTSPTTGTAMPASGRFHVNFKSPLTGGLGSANSGGKWAVAFKKTGYDALIITGKSSAPVYIEISSEKVEFIEADFILKMDAEKINDTLIEKASKGTRVMTIGEAGRKLSPIAAIINDRGRALGRGGGGAVFGSKNLMAIVVEPDKSIKIEPADPEGLRAGNESGAVFKARMKLEVGKMTRTEQTYGILPSMGTLGFLGMVYSFNELVHNNMQDTGHQLKDVEKISGEALRYHSRIAEANGKHIESNKGSCFNCPVACTRVTKILDEKGNIFDYGEGPEFETVALIGANLSIYDLTVITEANYWANRYGLDTISLGGTIAAFIELYSLIKNKQKDLSPEEDILLIQVKEFSKLHGEPQFGRKEILMPLVHAIGRSEGIGMELSQGSYKFCEKYGHPELSMSVKKLEMPAYDPRAAFLQALCYEMNNRGGCHLENGYTAIKDYCAGYGEWPSHQIEGTAIIARNAALGNTAIDIIGACAFASLSLSLDEFSSLINAVTGKNYNAGILEGIAWRVLTLERMFNIRAGFTKADDWLPDRFYNVDLDIEGRKVKCGRESFNQMHEEYYAAMGWDSDGIPMEKPLKDLQLKGIVLGN